MLGSGKQKLTSVLTQSECPTIQSYYIYGLTRVLRVVGLIFNFTHSTDAEVQFGAELTHIYIYGIRLHGS